MSENTKSQIVSRLDPGEMMPTTQIKVEITGVIGDLHEEIRYAAMMLADAPDKRLYRWSLVEDNNQRELTFEFAYPASVSFLCCFIRNIGSILCPERERGESDHA